MSKPLTLGDLRRLDAPDDTPIVLDGEIGLWDYATAEQASVIEAHPNIDLPNLPAGELWMNADLFEVARNEGRERDRYAGPKRKVVRIHDPE